MMNMKRIGMIRLTDPAGRWAALIASFCLFVFLLGMIDVPPASDSPVFHKAVRFYQITGQPVFHRIEPSGPVFILPDPVVVVPGMDAGNNMALSEGTVSGLFREVTAYHTGDRISTRGIPASLHAQ